MSRRSESGMTLLEVLIGLMLLGLTGLLLSEGLQFGARVWDHAETRAEAAIERANAIRTLRGLIEQAEPPGPDEGERTFSGDGSGLSFVTLEAARLAGGAARRIEVYRDPAARELRLGIGEPGDADASEALTLVTGATALAVRYYGRDKELAGDTWTERWVERSDLPSVVEITVALSDGRAPIRLRAKPRRTLSVACLVVGRRNCRAARP